MQSLWIFQLNQNLEDGSALTSDLESRLSEWKSHESPVESIVNFTDNRFIIIESFSDTSGCSKDFLRNEVRSAVEVQGLGLDEPSEIVYRDSETADIKSVALSELTASLQAGTFDPETMFYDLTVVHENTLDGWLKPISESWLNKYLPAV